MTRQVGICTKHITKKRNHRFTMGRVQICFTTSINCCIYLLLYTSFRAKVGVVKCGWYLTCLTPNCACVKRKLPTFILGIVLDGDGVLFCSAQHAEPSRGTEALSLINISSPTRTAVCREKKQVNKRSSPLTWRIRQEDLGCKVVPCL